MQLETAPPQPAAPDAAALTVLELPMDDARVRPLLDELAVEYDSRYGDLSGRGSAAAELSKYPAARPCPPGPGRTGTPGGGARVPERLPHHGPPPARGQAPVPEQRVHAGL